jgi:hypothetical protein
MKSMTYGVLPSKEEFLNEVIIEGDDKVTFGNDERFGTVTVTAEEVYEELKKAVEEWKEGNEWAGDWASCVLSVFNFEWI